MKPSTGWAAVLLLLLLLLLLLFVTLRCACCLYAVLVEVMLPGVLGSSRRHGLPVASKTICANSCLALQAAPVFDLFSLGAWAGDADAAAPACGHLRGTAAACMPNDLCHSTIGSVTLSSRSSSHNVIGVPRSPRCVRLHT
ncbi:hypothetical protein COO60DRAFT_1512983 [Scenedesmus sp. NREL 46B-D3]|nr:hypothetical protein COO60DRAFT_1512983 [Scenedesmus sp. NREL 46B-D3]